MRVFWPTRGLLAKTGTAVGWKEGESIVVVTVVDKFDTPATDGANANGKEKATDGEVRLLQPLARVHPAQHDTSSVPSDVHSDLFSIWTDSGRPVAYSVDAETVLYTPPKPLTHLTLGEVASAATGGENGATSAAPTVKDSDLRPVLSLLNESTAAQSTLAPPKRKILQYLGWGRNAFTTYRLLGTFRTQAKNGFGLVPAGLVAPGVAHTTSARTLPTVSLPEFTLLGRDFGGEIGGYTFGTDSVLERPTPITVLRNAFTLFMFWSTIGLFALTLIPYSQSLMGAFVAILTTVTSVLSADVVLFGRTLSLRRHSAFLKQVAVRSDQVKTLETSIRAEIDGEAPTNAFLQVRKAVFTDMLGGFFLSAIVSAVLAFYPMPPLSASAVADPMVAALQWLNAWPVGLKLNTPLSQYFCSAFSTVLVAWRDVVAPLLTEVQGPAITAILLVALGGLSFAFALLSDMVTLVTLHLRLCYTVMAKLCGWQLAALKGLYDLFRGKRWNVLRHRTDSHAYDLDTLFLGTLLFTLSTFLAPTVLAYGALFAVINLAIVGVEGTLALAVGALNTIPTHALMSRVLKPASVPAGIVFDVVPHPSVKVGDSTALAPRFTLLLRTTPKSIPTIVSEWLRAAQRAAGTP